MRRNKKIHTATATFLLPRADAQTPSTGLVVVVLLLSSSWPLLSKATFPSATGAEPGVEDIPSLALFDIFDALIDDTINLDWMVITCTGCRLIN